MNPWQLAQQLKHELATVAWEDGSAQVVFGPRSVNVYAGRPSDDELPVAFPFAMVTIDAGIPDADEPSLIRQTFSVVIAVETAGDPLGEFAVIGSARADLGKSAGAGIGEVSERVRSAIQKLSAFDGASILASGSGASALETLGRGRQVAIESYALEALCTSQVFYASPQQVRQASAAVLRWRGDHCSPRFDFLRYRVGWVTGQDPAASPDDATIVYTGTATECATTIVGNRTYSVWADYDPRDTGNVAATSESIVGSYVAT